MTPDNLPLRSQIPPPEVAARTLLQHRKAFMTYNIARLRELIRFLSTRKTALFQAIPFLLHVNAPFLPGYQEGAMSESGLYGFFGSGFWKAALKQFKLTESKIRPYVSTTAAINGLYLMGSAGTLAQVSYSDFDYWVVVRRNPARPANFERLRRKLDHIEQWARDVYHHDIRFFILHADDIRDNRFGPIDDQSSGATQRTLLKDEFYRTLILIGGRIPLWALLPPGIGRDDYQSWIQQAQQATGTTFFADDYADLGGVTAIDASECPDALLWQLYKANHDPAKALIKASLIAAYYFHASHYPPLCETVKQRFAEPIADSYLLDPYALLFERVVDFHRRTEDREGLALVQNCIYLRLSDALEPQPGNAANPRSVLRSRLLADWRWSSRQTGHLDRYARWPEKEKRQFEQQVVKKIRHFCERMAQAHVAVASTSNCGNNDELRVLRNAAGSLFETQPGKLPACSLDLRAKAKSRQLALIGSDDPLLPVWSVWDQSRIGPGCEPDPVFEGPELLRTIGFLLYNRLWPPPGSQFRFITGASGLTQGALRRTVHQVAAFVGRYECDLSVYNRTAQWQKIVVVLIGPPDGPVAGFQSAEYLLTNSWGEFYFDLLELSGITADAVKYRKIADLIQHYKNSSSADHCEHYLCLPGIARPQAAIDQIEKNINKPQGLCADRKINKADNDLAEGASDGPAARPFLDQ